MVSPAKKAAQEGKAKAEEETQAADKEGSALFYDKLRNF